MLLFFCCFFLISSTQLNVTTDFLEYSDIYKKKIREIIFSNFILKIYVESKTRMMRMGRPFTTLAKRASCMAVLLIYTNSRFYHNEDKMS